MNILNIVETPRFDNSIESYEVHSYNPYNNNFKENDEIRIPIHQQDIYLLPSASSLYIEGYVSVTEKGSDGKLIRKSINFSNNPILFLFQDIRYELNGVEIDRIKNAGITTTMKSYISMSNGQAKVGEIWGWNTNGITTPEGHFNALVPLNKILGFAEDYNKILINCKHELILTRSNSNLNSVKVNENDIVKIDLHRVQWRVPHIKVSDRERLLLLKHLEKDRTIQMAFRNWDLYEYPLLPKTTKHSWAVKTTSQVEKPRYVILGLQTNKKNSRTSDCSTFDHCDMTNVTLYLNSQYYPYDSLNLKFNENKYNILYEMYSQFRHSYYGLSEEPLLDLKTFKNSAPLFVIDCSRQNENIKVGPVDVRVEFQTSKDFPDNTTAYCLIINDRLFEYKPLSNIVRKLS